MALCNGSRAMTVSRETTDRLDEFIRLLGHWNQSLNLVSRGESAHKLVQRHLSESLALTSHIPANVDRIIDLGSGGGFPAIPIAITTGLHVDLIESDQRKAAFLQNTLARLALAGKVWPQRIETSAVPPAQCITARALAPLPQLLGYCYPKLTPDGVALLLKGERLEAELRAAAPIWTMKTQIISPPAIGTRILKVAGLEPVHAPTQQ